MLAILQSGSLNVKETFLPESMSLNLSERDSTAAITLGPDGPELAVGDWVQDLTEPGAGIVWRVRTIDTQHDTETRTVTLEHMIASLGDRIIPDEVTSEDMGGTSEGVSAHTAASYVISYQNTWQLGDFAYSVSNPYKFDGDTLKAALTTITGSLEDPIWEYDFSHYPFTLHIRQLSSDAGSELRAGRNISTLKYTVDRSRMYTRFYPVGKDNLRISGDYVSKNENLYGRIDKTETDQSKETEAELIAWANDRLRRHAQPSVTVTISGLDLSTSTGEALDQLRIGKRCRVPLPESGDLISEKVTKLSWRDKIKDPESLTVTLANALEDVQSIIKQEQAKSSSGGRAGAKANQDKITLIGEVEEGLYSAIAQTSTYIMMEVVNTKSDLHSTIELTASSIRADVSSAKSALYSSIMMTSTNIYVQVGNAKSALYSSIEVTANGINASVASAKSALYSSIMITSTNIYTQVGNAKSDLYSSIEVTASSIRADVSSAKSALYSSIMMTSTNIYVQVGNAKSALYSSIEVTANGINASVASAKSALYSSIMITSTNIYTQVGNAKSGLYSSIEQTASSIRTEVSNARSTMWSSIVQNANGITSKVGKGEVISCINQTAETITIQASKINLEGYVTSSQLTTSWLSGLIANISTLNVNTVHAGSLYEASGQTWARVATQTYVSGCVWNLRIQHSGNTYTLQKRALGDDGNWADVGSFSRAITSWTQGWSNGRITVTAQPQGQSHRFPAISVSGSNNITSNGTYTYKVMYEDDNGDDQETGRTKSVTVNVTPTVDNWSRTNFASDATARSSKQLSIPVSVDVDGTTYDHTFTTSAITLERYASTYYANVKCGNVIIARLYIDGFTD